MQANDKFTAISKPLLILVHARPYLYMIAAGLGIAGFAHCGTFGAAVLLVCALVLVFLSWVLARRLPLFGLVLGVCAVAALAGARSASRLYPTQEPTLPKLVSGKSEVIVEAVVTDFLKRTPKSAIAIAEVERICLYKRKVCRKWHGKVLLKGSALLRSSVLPGDIVRCKGRFWKPMGGRNPGGRDWQEYYLRRGIVGRVYIRKNDPVPEVIGQAELTPLLALRRMRELAVWRLADVLPQHVSGTALALALGDRSMLDYAARLNFARAGTAHLLAISGLHIGILTIVLLTLFRIPLLIPNHGWLTHGDWMRRALLLTIPIVWGFVLLSGAKPPAVRAAIMVSFFGFARVVNRRASAFVALAYAGLMILLVEPEAMFEVSFWLTFAAVAAILLLAPLARRSWVYRQGKYTYGVRALGWFALRRMFDAVWVSFAGFVATAPIIFYVFKDFTPMGLVSNAFVVPVAAVVVVPLAFLCGVWALLRLPNLEELSRWLAAALDGLMQAQAAIGRLTPKIGSVWIMVVVIALLVLIFVLTVARGHGWKFRKSIGIASLSAGLVFGLIMPEMRPATTRILIFNAGYHLAVLFQQPTGRDFLVRDSDSLAIKQMLHKALIALGIDKPNIDVRLDEILNRRLRVGEFKLTRSISGVNLEGYEVELDGVRMLILRAKRQPASLGRSLRKVAVNFDVVLAPVGLPCSELRELSKQANWLILNTGAPGVIKAKTCSRKAFITARDGAIECLRRADTLVCHPFNE